MENRLQRMNTLYKYTRINGNTINSLIDRYAWYARPSTLNDPFDCGLSQSLMGSSDQWGILSLSAVCDNIIMWSHYADSHRGICIAYTDYTDQQLQDGDLQSQINPYKDEIDDLPIIRNALPVRYLDTNKLDDELASLPQSLDEFNATLKDYNTGPLTDEKFRNGFLIRSMKSLFRKHRDWEYEKEYRIVTYEGAKAIAAPGVVTTIFLGMNSTTSQCQQIFRVGTAIGAKVLKMERVPRKYQIVPRDLTEEEKSRGKLDFSRPINRYLEKLGVMK
jgi:hypothetical protein